MRGFFFFIRLFYFTKKEAKMLLIGSTVTVELKYNRCLGDEVVCLEKFKLFS